MVEDPVKKAIRDRINVINQRDDPTDKDNAFYIVDLGEVYRLHQKWSRNLSQVSPFYAVKCNPDPELLRFLARLGVGFDCASLNEMKTILSLGINPSRIILAHPCKTQSTIAYAKQHGISHMTFDNEDELYKIAQIYPKAQLLLRIYAHDPDAMYPLGIKYGASLESSRDLLSVARKLELDVIGISFHIGSGAKDMKSLEKTIIDAKTIFDQAKDVGYDLNILDIGGGYDSSIFDKMSCTLKQALHDNFPVGVKFIAEPGRFFVKTAYTIVCNVIARRKVSSNSAIDMIYLNDGIYGSFFDSFCGDPPTPNLFINELSSMIDSSKKSHDSFEYSIWGPTCCGLDRINESAIFPVEIQVGNWVYYRNMGAYSTSCATQFNGFTNTFHAIYISTEPTVCIESIMK